MKIDNYTRIVLTIIAIALVLNLFKPLLLEYITPNYAEAQTEEPLLPDHLNVIITGITTSTPMPVSISGDVAITYGGGGEGLPVIVMKPVHIYN